MKQKRSMTLRTRIFLTFLLVIIIPAIVCSLAFFALLHFKLNEIEENYGISNPGIESIYNSSYLISSKMEEIVIDIEKELTADASMADDPEYLSQINAELLENRAFLAVRKNDDIIYNGSDTMSTEQLAELLPKAGNEALEFSEDTLIHVRDQILMKRIEFPFSDGSYGAIFLVTRLNQVMPELQSWFSELVLVLILILTLTCILLGYGIYRSVIDPINDLKAAAQNIRDGNLDFRIRSGGVQEMNDLCNDFEEMRIRLKEGADEKIEFDSQSKELISNISHDLKTPVTAIKGYVEGIMDGVADTPEKQEKYLRTIYSKTMEIDRLINELTLYSKIDTNRIPYNFTKLKVNEYFEDCREELQMELEQQGIQFEYTNYLREDPTIIADPEQLRRVINNIIGNSVKYMDKDPGIIRVQLKDVGDFIQVEFEDNGKGIAQRDLTRIFDRFYRTDTARSSRGGSGIGLSIVKKILEDHEGKVWASSKEGVGTTIAFVLRKYQEPEI